jgi:hypothetical protein
MMATRKTFVEAKIQQRPDEAWFVMGEPSSGILILNFWMSAIAADREESTALAEFELRAARARRFYQVNTSPGIYQTYYNVLWGLP